MSDVTLYHWEPNANSGKPMLALMEKGVAFDSHYLDLLNFDQHQARVSRDQSRRARSRRCAMATGC